MEPVEIELGGRKYLIEELSINRSECWRQMLSGPLDDIVDVVTGLDAEIDSIADAKAIIPRIKMILMGSVKQIADLVLAYDSDIGDEAEYILEHATGSQIMEAFIVMVKMAFPFGEALGSLMQISRGLPSAATSTSSPALNGASGETISAK
ncbi:MAG: hypothetical protein AAF702_32945 [Chloroflexota bacterium]